MTVEEKAEKYADDVAFLVPYDGTMNFYDEKRLKTAKIDYLAGYNEAMLFSGQKEELPEEAGCDFCRDEQGYTIGNMYVCDKCGRQVP